MRHYPCSASAAVGIVLRLAMAAAAGLLLALPAAAQKRVALVVGNSAYVHAAALPNPVNDASDMASAISTSRRCRSTSC
jgi:hypothetical protein